MAKNDIFANAVEEPKVHTMIRPIATTLRSEGDPIELVDQEVSAWISRGYRLHSTHVAGIDQNAGVVNMIYVLVRDVEV